MTARERLLAAAERDPALRALLTQPIRGRGRSPSRPIAFDFAIARDGSPMLIRRAKAAGVVDHSAALTTPTRGGTL